MSKMKTPPLFLLCTNPYSWHSSPDHYLSLIEAIPWWLSGKESACNSGDTGLIPGSGRSPGEGNGNPLQYSCLENSMDRGAWQATVHVSSKESDMTKQINSNSNKFLSPSSFPVTPFHLPCVAVSAQIKQETTQIITDYGSEKITWASGYLVWGTFCLLFIVFEYNSDSTHTDWSEMEWWTD